MGSLVVAELPAKVDVVDELAATKGPNPPIRKLRRLDVQIWELPEQSPMGQDEVSDFRVDAHRLVSCQVA